MGCVLKFGGKDPTPPSGEAVDGLVCVHKSAASIGQAAQKAVWSDAGTFGGKSCSIWPIVPRDNEGLAVESFYISLKDKTIDPNPCYPTPYVLRLSSTMVGPTKKLGELLEIKYSTKNIRCGGKSISIFKPQLSK